MTDRHKTNIERLAPLRQALYDFEPQDVAREIGAVFAPETPVRLAHPLGETDRDGLMETAYLPLFTALPDLERREIIRIAGDEPGGDWVGCAGIYAGTFLAPWLDIPPTGHAVALRFHEFFRFVDGQVVEMQSLWDLPDLMMQAGVWPMAPSLGREWLIPGPATGDGLIRPPRDAGVSAASCQVVVDMLAALKRHPGEGGPELMEMERFWHPRMSWYGPAGIGTGRGYAGFRHWHQIPFLNAMPDRGQRLDEIVFHFFADNAYVGVTGWPNMIQTVTDGGWMGIAPAGKRITMKSLDFWRIEDGRIRENWVMVDLLDAYDQLGVDVLGRLREFNKARTLAPITLPDWRSV